MRPLRALIELTRDRTAAASADAERGVAVASRSGDPQSLAPSLCARAMVRLVEGRLREAVTDFEDALAIGERLAGALNVGGALPTFAWLAVDLERGRQIEPVVAAAPSRRWADAARAIVGGDAATAADLLAEIGHRPAEAYARLRAGGEHIARALAFYQAVGATRYVREAEALLAASG
jgi:hypothetical protein